jgi:hypothetical protein
MKVASDALPGASKKSIDVQRSAADVSGRCTDGGSASTTTPGTDVITASAAAAEPTTDATRVRPAGDRA